MPVREAGMSGSDVAPTLTAQQIMQAIAASFDGEPDEKIISVGHYVQHPERVLPKFYARMQITLGDVRRCANG